MKGHPQNIKSIKFLTSRGQDVFAATAHVLYNCQDLVDLVQNTVNIEVFHLPSFIWECVFVLPARLSQHNHGTQILST